jgi:hypothetical protein
VIDETEVQAFRQLTTGGGTTKDTDLSPALALTNKKESSLMDQAVQPPTLAKMK